MRRLLLAALALCVATPCAAQNRMINIVGGSGTLATGGTSQQVFGANDARSYLFIQNPINATEPLFVDYGIPASTTSGSVELAPGGTVSFIGVMVPTMTVNVNAATAGHRYIAKQSGNN